MRLTAVTCLILALAGCADSTPGYVAAKEQAQAARELRTRYDADLDNPAFAILAGKVDLHQSYTAAENPCAGLGQDRYATAEERAALKQWAALRGAYVGRYEAIVMQEPDGSSQVKRAADEFDAVVDNGLRSQSVLISNLAEGRMTYCQFAAEDKDLTQGFLKEATTRKRVLLWTMSQDYALSHPDALHNPYR